MTVPTDYDQALGIIRRLDRPTQARLVAQVVQELATEPDASLRRSHQAWARLTELRDLAAHRGQQATFEARLAEVTAPYAGSPALQRRLKEQRLV